MYMKECTVVLQPLTISYYKNNLSGPIREGTSTNSAEGLTSLDSTEIFGSEGRRNWISNASTENYRGYIPLARPILNYMLSGNYGKEVVKFLGLKAKEIEDIMMFNKVMIRETGELISKSEILPYESIDDYLVGPEVVEHLIETWDQDQAIVRELRIVLQRLCFKYKVHPDDIGNIDKSGVGVRLSGDYYFNDINEAGLKDEVTVDMIEAMFQRKVAGRSNNLTFLYNTDKDKLSGILSRCISVLPIVFREKSHNRIHTLETQYKEIRRANNDLRNLLSSNNVKIQDYINAYERLNKVCNFLLYKHDNLHAKKSLALAERLNGKKKHLRGKMISKRSDYTGRSVVVCNPDLKLYQIGIPDAILYKVLRHELIKKCENLAEVATIKDMTIKECVDKMGRLGLIEDAVAILNRAPTLHRLSMLAYEVIRSKSNAIEVNTLLNEGYNMDHDGDTSAIKICITEKAKAEALGLLHAKHNLFKPSDGKCTLTPRLDMIYGLNKMTDTSYVVDKPVAVTNSYGTVEEMLYTQKIRLWSTVDFKGTPRIAGHVLMESILPKDVYNENLMVTDKTINEIVEKLLEVQTNDEFLETLWKLSKKGFDMAKLYPPKISILTNMDMKNIRKPFDIFYKELEELDEWASMGLSTQLEYDMDFNASLDKLKETVESSVIENMMGADVTPAVEMLNGLYMTTRDKFRLDSISDGSSLVAIDSLEELRYSVVNRLIKGKDTILYKGKRCLAGRRLVSEIAGKEVTAEIDATNIDKFFSEEVKILGLQLAKLHSTVKIDKKILDYRYPVDLPILTPLYEITKNEFEVDEEPYDEELQVFNSREELLSSILHGSVEPGDTILFEKGKKTERCLAGRKLASLYHGKEIKRQLDEFSALTFMNPSLRELGNLLKGKFNKSSREELSKYVSESFRKGSDTVRRLNGFIDMVESGARGKRSNLVQMFIFKGQIAKSNGEPFSAIIANSFVTQLTTLEHFIGTYGSRKGVLAKSVKPQDTGYLERLLWHSPEDVIITEEDCGTTNGLPLSLNDIIDEKKEIDKDIDSRIEDARKELAKIITGRYIVGNNKLLTRKEAEAIALKLDVNERIRMRSPITCSNPCCSKCYGVDLTCRGRAAVGTPIGFIASESIGEPGTQLTLKVFQKGGLASRQDSDKTESDRISAKFKLSDITDTKKHPEYDPIAWRDGKTVIKTIDSDFNYVLIEGSKRKIRIPSDVGVKEQVKQGESLCLIPGDQDLKEKEIFSSVEDAQKLLTLSTYFIYNNVTSVNIKHFETIAASLKVRIVLRDDTHNPNLKLLQPYTQTEWARKNLKDTTGIEYKEVLIGVKDLPIVRESCLSNFLMERVNEGIRRALLIGNKDNLDNPFNATVMGLKPKVGLEYNPNYIKDRLVYEEDRLDVYL